VRNLCRVRRVSSAEPASQKFEARRLGGSRIGDRHIQALLFVMLEIAITLILGFASDTESASGPSANLTARDKGDAGPSEKGTGLVGTALTAVRDWTV
jgi:hypothetical protein